MNSPSTSPTREAASRLPDYLVIEALGEQAVVCERLQLCFTMTAAPTPWQKLVDVDELLSSRATVAHYRSERACTSICPGPFNVFEKGD
jgi:hypothetical protein